MKKVIGIGLALFVFFLLVGSNSTEAAVNTSSCVILTQELGLNSEGDQVTALQHFLNFEPFTMTGQSGYGFFGANTESLLRDFQSAKGLPATGKTDAATRTKIRSLTCVSVQAAASVTAADGSDPWYNANCLPYASMGIYGVYTPVIYAGVVGTLIQINKPFSVSINGTASTTLGGKLSFSDPSNVSVTPSSCTTGFTSSNGNETCTVIFSGQPREIWLKESNPGRTPYPVCTKMTVQRAAHAYSISLEVDKATFGSNEAFKVTLHGISRSRASEAFNNYGPMRFTRSNAPYSSCESSVAGNICQGDSILSCSLTQGTSNEADPEYLCAANYLDVTGDFRFPNKTADVTYTLSLPSTSDSFDTFTSTGGSKTIKLLHYGTNGSDTNYGSCANDYGVNPASPLAGCTRCLNIPSRYRTHITSCQAVGGDIYHWANVGPATGFDHGAPLCVPANPSGIVCPDVDAGCVGELPIRDNITAKYVCKNTNPVVNNAFWHGKVFKASDGTPLGGVTVTANHVTAGWLGVTCPSVTTNDQGEYVFDGDKAKSICLLLAGGGGGNFDFTKTGYDSQRVSSGSEYDKTIPNASMSVAGTAAAAHGAISLTPSTATLNRSPGSRVVFTLLNGLQQINYGGLDVCYEVVKRTHDAFTPTDIDKPANPTSCHWIDNWARNSDWTPNGADLLWEINYNAAAWDVPGLKVLIAFRKHNHPEEVTYAVLSTNDGAKSAEAAPPASAASASAADDGSSGNGASSAAASVAAVVSDAVSAVVDAVSSAVSSVVDTVSQLLGGRGGNTHNQEY